MSAFLRKYGVAATLQGVPLITRAAIDLKANPTLAAGDVKVSKDGGSWNNLTTLPSASPASGSALKVDTSAAEMQAKVIVIQLVDQTSPKEWEDQVIIIETFGHASALHPFDLDTATQTVEVNTKTGFSLAADQSAVTIGTVNAFAAGAIASLWNALTSGITTAGSIGKLIKDYLDAAISSRMATFTYTAPDNASITAIKAKTDNLPAAPAAVGDIPSASTIATAVWASTTRTLSSFGTLVADMATAVWGAVARTITGGSLTVAPAVPGDIPTADITAIKAKTDNLPAVPASEGNVSAVGSAVVSVGNLVDGVKAKTDNLPADPASNTQVNTRLAASAYTAPDNADIVLIKAKTDNLPASPAAVSNIPTASDNATAVWAAGSRTLTSFGSLVADIASAVWASGTRTLTGFGSLVSDTAIAVWGASVKLITGGALTISPATPADIPTAKIDAIKAQTDKMVIDNDGYIEARVNAGTIEVTGDVTLSDESLAAVREDLATSTQAAAAQTAAEQARDAAYGMAAKLGAVNVVMSVPVLLTGEIALIPGEDYYSVDGRSLIWQESDWPDLSGATVTWKFRCNGSTEVAASIQCAIINSDTVQLELSHTQTAAIPYSAGDTRDNYELWALLQNGHNVRLAYGPVFVGV